MRIYFFLLASLTMDQGKEAEPVQSPVSAHESENGSDHSTSLEEPSPLEIPCGKRQRVEQPDPDYNPNDDVDDEVSHRQNHISWTIIIV